MTFYSSGYWVCNLGMSLESRRSYAKEREERFKYPHIGTYVNKCSGVKELEMLYPDIFKVFFRKYGKKE